jgi:hypothetical protein
MRTTRPVPHFQWIDKPAIEARFFDHRKHRASLRLPFIGRTTNRTLCVIGQNPSAADENVADKTIRYLSELIYRTRQEFSALLILNLYSRVDTTKSEKNEILDSRCVQVFDDAVQTNQDFLLVYGKLRKEGAYDFPSRARAVSQALMSKNVLQLDLGTQYPPHPGNPKILYTNFTVRLAPLHHDGA